MLDLQKRSDTHKGHQKRLLLGDRAYLIEQVVQVVVDLFIVKAGVLILVHWFVFIVGLRLGCLNDRTVKVAPVDIKSANTIT